MAIARTVAAIALGSGLWCGAVATQAPAEVPGQTDLSGLRLRLRALRDTYVMQPDDPLQVWLRDGKPPDLRYGVPVPGVVLVAELRNVSTRAVQVTLTPSPTLMLRGKNGEPVIDATVGGWYVPPSRVIALEPGESLEHPVLALSYPVGTRERHAWWTRPGDYNLTALWGPPSWGVSRGDGYAALVSEQLPLRVLEGSTEAYWVQALDDTDAIVRRAAVEALTRRTVAGRRDELVPWRHLLPHAASRLSDSAAPVRLAALKLLAISPKDASDQLDDIRKRLADPDPGVRAAAVHAVARIGGRDPQTAADVAKALKDVDVQVRRMAARELREPLAKGDGPVADALLAMLADPDWKVRADAVRSLGRMESRGAAPKLLAHLRTGDPNRDVRRELLRALGRMGHEPARPDLTARLKDPESEAAAREALRELDKRRPRDDGR